MEISEIVNNLLDTINRPNDDVWVKRATAFVIQSFNRLGQKLLYEPLELQITADTLGEPTDNYITLQKAGAYPQAVYSEKLKQFLDIKFLTENYKRPLEVYEVIRTGTTYYFNKALAGTSIYIFFTKQFELNESLEELSTMGLELFKQAYDFIYYDSLVRLFLLLNSDLDRISMARQLRDEAYVDLTSWANAINDRGTLSIEG